MIQVEFVEDSRSELRFDILPLLVEHDSEQLSRGADLLFQALNGKMPTRQPVAKAPPPLAIAAAVANPPTLGTLHRLPSRRQRWKPDSAVAA